MIHCEYNHLMRMVFSSQYRGENVTGTPIMLSQPDWIPRNWGYQPSKVCRKMEETPKSSEYHKIQLPSRKWLKVTHLFLRGRTHYIASHRRRDGKYWSWRPVGWCKVDDSATSNKLEICWRLMYSNLQQLHTVIVWRLMHEIRLC